MQTQRGRLGVIGGSGLYAIEGLTDVQEVMPQTPFGAPSDAIVTGMLDEQPLAFLPRHGRGHRISPTEVPSRANIYALKSLGVEWIISVSAVGSLREDYAPLDLVVPNQIFDRTRSRVNSFFEGGVVAHISFAEPFCPHLSEQLWTEMGALSDFRAHRGGTYVCMEGPQFSTYAESMTYKTLGYSVIGMTNMPEAKLAREAEICYATVAMVTDFDCWHPDHDAVTVQDIIRVLTSNADKAKALVARLAKEFPREHEPCPIGSDRALDTALITAPEARDPELLKKLDAVAGRILRG